MNSYKIKLKKSAKKFITENKREGLKFYNAFFQLAEDKSNFKKYDIKKIQGKEDAFRIRLGKYWAIFRVIEDEILILIIDIGSRGDIYK